jgi:4-aminobutyrate aminotransferase-like enzyme
MVAVLLVGFEQFIDGHTQRPRRLEREGPYRPFDLHPLTAWNSPAAPLTMADSYFGAYSVGRTGRWFGFQHLGITPDAVALGKGIGGGYPLAVAAVVARFHRALLEAGYIVGLRPGTSTLRLDPPLCLEPAHADAFLAAFRSILRLSG